MSVLPVPKHITFADAYTAHGHVDIPMGYKNFKWTGFSCSSKAFLNQAYRYNIMYTNNNSEVVASCSGDGSIGVRHFDMLFGVISLGISVPGPWNFHLTITGYHKSKYINTHTLTLIGPGYRHIDLRWADIHELKFCSNNHFILTDLFLTRSF